MPTDEKIKSEKVGEMEQLRAAADPLMKYLAENHNPHVKAIITSTSFELLGGIMSQAGIWDHLDPDS